MAISTIIITFVIYLFLPLIGIISYFRLKKRMINERIQNPPTNDLFIIFATYGGLLILTCTSIVWPMSWSGMASLGTFYLILIAPLIMGIIAYKHSKTKNISKYHNGVFLAGILYFLIAPLVFALLFLKYDN